MGQVRTGIKESAGKRKGSGSTGHGNPYLARVLGEAAVAASKTDTFLGERYRRIARRRGKRRAIVAVGRSILVIVWHLLSDPTARFQDLGASFYDTRINADRAKRNHIRQLEDIGYRVTLAARRLSRRAPNCLDLAPLRCAGVCRLPAHRGFSDQDALAATAGRRGRAGGGRRGRGRRRR